MSANYPERVVKSFDQVLTDSNFGMSADDAVQTLAKALGSTGVNGLADGTALNLENLDGLMSSVLFDNTHLVLWNDLPKVPSLNQLYQYNVRDRYGSSRSGPGFVEGGAASGSTGGWTRHTDNVRWLGVRGGISHQEKLAGRLGGVQIDPEAEELRNRTLELLEKVERWSLWGSAAVLDENRQTVNYDGIYTQMAANAPTRVKDMQGQPLQPSNLDEAAYALFQDGKLHNFKNIKQYMDGVTQLDFGKRFYDAQRVTIGTTPNDAPLIPGTPVRGFDTSFGNIPFQPSVFMDPVEGGAPLLTVNGLVADSGAPAAPAAPTFAVAANGASQFIAGDEGTFYYVASAFNSSGESLGTVSATGAAVTAGDQTTLTITRVTTACVGYRVYRGTASDGSDALYIGFVAQPASGDATFIDRNILRPGTKVSIILDLEPDSIAVPMMAPLVKWPLAIVNTTEEFMLLLYSGLTVKLHKRQYLFKNIGRYLKP